MLLHLIDRCRWRNHFVIRFLSKLFKNWGCVLRDLFFNSFGKHSFRNFSCSTRVGFSRETNTPFLIFCHWSSTICCNSLNYPCARSSACLIANFACLTVLKCSITEKQRCHGIPCGGVKQLRKSTIIFPGGFELSDIEFLILRDYELSLSVEQ